MPAMGAAVAPFACSETGPELTCAAVAGSSGSPPAARRTAFHPDRPLRHQSRRLLRQSPRWKRLRPRVRPTSGAAPAVPPTDSVDPGGASAPPPSGVALQPSSIKTYQGRRFVSIFIGSSFSTVASAMESGPFVPPPSVESEPTSSGTFFWIAVSETRDQRARAI